jgi:hypothetical protein
MNTDVLISLVIVLLPLSFISERLSNLIKLYLSTGGIISLYLSIMYENGVAIGQVSKITLTFKKPLANLLRNYWKNIA